MTAGIVAFALAVAAMTLLGDVLGFGALLSVLGTIFDTRVWLVIGVAVFAASLLLYVWSLFREDPDALVRSGRCVEALFRGYDEL